ncbi:hypothetical protein PoB_004298400 [Plakobranchus ocellatus]|uniref:Uncharacterized protein n=1 Tax=Plakobranchus ocellatus TaxID=259542 RepID=A0AAV4BCH5_9GAST|nr:hypothetical protein PoB_004298400 [Plakobranchus ocellatus]
MTVPCPLVFRLIGHMSALAPALPPPNPRNRLNVRRMKHPARALITAPGDDSHLETLRSHFSLVCPYKVLSTWMRTIHSPHPTAISLTAEPLGISMTIAVLPCETEESSPSTIPPPLVRG